VTFFAMFHLNLGYSPRKCEDTYSNGSPDVKKGRDYILISGPIQTIST